MTSSSKASPRRAEWQHLDVLANGVRLHCVAAGPPGAPLVLLLHGFPDGWYSWRHQLTALAAAGFRAVAPDMRGYGRSEKPRGVAAYALERLVADVAGLVDVLGAGRPAAGLVGHDWGGGIAWSVGAAHPERVERLAVVNAPHGAAMKVGLRHPRQALRSWYMAAVQAPWLPELLLRAGGLRFVDAAYAPARSRSPATVTAGDVAYLRREIGRAGALTAALNYYRALPRRLRMRDDPLLRPARVPALVVWGEDDPFLDVSLLKTAPAWAPEVVVRRLPDAGHFSHQERPDQVNELLLRWLGTHREGCTGARPAAGGGAGRPLSFGGVSLPAAVPLGWSARRNPASAEQHPRRSRGR